MRSSLLVSPAGSANSRRAQMSGVFHSVRTTEPGVSGVPNPPGPLFHEASLKTGVIQSSAGFSKMNRQVTAFFSEVGTTSVILGGVGSGAHLSGRAPLFSRSRSAHFFQSAAS